MLGRRSKKLKLIKKTQANYMSATFLETLSCLKMVYFIMSQIFSTIAQSLTFSLMISSRFFVKHKLKLFKCEVCENYFKTEYNIASHETTIHNKGCDKIFKNNNIYQLTSLFNMYGSCLTLKLQNCEVSYSYSLSH